MSATAPTDEDLARRAAAGDRAASAELVNRYNRRLFGFLRTRTPRGRETSDLVQDVWLKVWRALPKWKPENFQAWVFRIARNTAIDAGQPTPVESLPSDPPAPPPPPPPTDPEVIAKLYACLKELMAKSPYFHTAVVMQMGGATLKEIATAQGKPDEIDTIKTRIFRGKKTLRVCLGEIEL